MKNICVTELVTANSPVSGYPLLQAVLVFHVVMWIAQVTQIHTLTKIQAFSLDVACMLQSYWLTQSLLQ